MKNNKLLSLVVIIFLLLSPALAYGQATGTTQPAPAQSAAVVQGASAPQQTTTKVASASNTQDKAAQTSPGKAAGKFYTQLALLLVIIYFGVKRGGVSLGLFGGLGVTILVLIFRDQPGTPPIDVMLIILAVGTTSSILEATGALGMIVRFAERILRSHPEYVVYLAPTTTFLLTVLVGTGHAVYPLLPVIYDVAYKQRIRPERPMAIASVASQMGITASPIAAALAATLGLAIKNHVEVSPINILFVTLPACFIGMLIAATWSLKRGLDLDKDPVYLEKMKDPELRAHMVGNIETSASVTNKKEASWALTLFLLGIAAVVIIAFFPKVILPLAANGKPTSMAVVIQFIMFAAGAIIVFVTGVKAKTISDTKVFNAAMIAVVMIFGIAWMSDTVITSNQKYILSIIGGMVKAHPWTFAIAMFCCSAFLKSQAATILVVMPLGFTLGIPMNVLIGCIPASYAYFFFCFYPSDLATIQFDRTGTTHIGKYILNHSFMIPGIIGVVTATIIAMLLSLYVVNPHLTTLGH